MSGFLGVLGGTSLALRRLLEAWGVTSAGAIARLFTVQEIEEGVFYDLAGEANLGFTTDELDAAFVDFLRVLRAARFETRRINEVSAQLEAFDISLIAESAKRRRVNTEYDEKFRRVELEQAQTSRPLALAKRQGAVVRRVSAEFDGDERGRHLAEEKRREAAIERLVDLLHHQFGGDRGRLRLSAAGRRASTLEKQTRAMTRFVAWLRARFGRDRLEDATDWVSYLEDRAAEPCGRSVLTAIHGLAQFCDSVAGRVGSEAHSASPEVKNALKELRYRIEESKGQDVRTQALRPPLSLLRGLEEFVVGPNNCNYDRAMAWFYLVSTWGVLRFDDHRGIHPGRVVMSESGLIFDLERTKTTGSGKAQQCRTVHIDPDAFVSEADWLSVGYSTFMGLGFVNRDYALVCKGVRETILEREVTYEEYVGHLRRITTKIEVGTNRFCVTVPRVTENERTFGSALAGLLTAHSWRAFLPTAASGLGATQSDLDALGCWRPKGGMVYVRQSSTRALKYQKTVATSLRSGDAGFLNEAAEMRVYECRLPQRGLSDTEVEETLEGVFARPRGGRVAEDGVAEQVTGSHSGASSACGHSSVSAVPIAAESIAGVQSQTATGVKRAPKIPEGEVGYVLSLVRRGKQIHKKLHYLGQCHLVPGVDYLRYDWIGPQRLGLEFYDSVCTRCWPIKDAGEDETTSSDTGEAYLL